MNFRFTRSYDWHCRWCGEPYESKKALTKAGHCSTVCKQAHYRAYKKFKEGVTQKSDHKKDLTDRPKMSNAKQGGKKTSKR